MSYLVCGLSEPTATYTRSNRITGLIFGAESPVAWLVCLRSIFLLRGSLCLYCPIDKVDAPKAPPGMCLVTYVLARTSLIAVMVLCSSQTFDEVPSDHVMIWIWESVLVMGVNSADWLLPSNIPLRHRIEFVASVLDS